MLSEIDARDLIRRIAFLATAEIILLPIVMIPVVSAGIVMLPFLGLKGLEAILGYFAFLFLSGLVVDILLAQFRRKPAPVPGRSAEAIKHLLSKLEARGAPRLGLSRIKILPSDLSVGAYVRGALKPKIVVSAGMFVSLLREIPSAKVVLCHELGHVANNDKFFLSILFMWLASVGLFFLSKPSSFDQSIEAHGPWAGLSIVGTLWVISKISRRREYMADAYAAVLCGSELVTSCLSSIEMEDRSKASFFHPSIEQRIQSVSGGSVARLRPSIGILFYYVVVSIPGIYSFAVTGDEFYLATCTGSAIGITLEFSRAVLLPSSLRES